jgi:CD109 antigen
VSSSLFSHFKDSQDFFFLFSNDRASIVRKVPDGNKSWYISAFSIDPVNGLRFTGKQSRIDAFKPLFVSAELPSSSRQGEVVTVRVIVFNYLNEDQDAEVILSNENGDFEFEAVDQEYNYDYSEKLPNDAERTQTGLVKAQSTLTVSFPIRPLNVGPITIKVLVKTPKNRENFEKQLNVES